MLEVDAEKIFQQKYNVRSFKASIFFPEEQRGNN
jgi:hypothetical protein